MEIKCTQPSFQDENIPHFINWVSHNHLINNNWLLCVRIFVCYLLYKLDVVWRNESTNNDHERNWILTRKSPKALVACLYVFTDGLRVIRLFKVFNGKKIFAHNKLQRASDIYINGKICTSIHMCMYLSW